MDAYDQIAAALPGSGHGRRSPAPFVALELRGPDAADFLQRLCSQDVLGLRVGAVAPAAFLSPKGKLLAIAMLARLAEDRILVETQADTGQTVFDLLDRYHFAEQLVIDRCVDHPACAELLGVDLPQARGLAPWTVAEGADGAVVLAGRRRGLGFVRCHGSEAAVAAFAAEVPSLDPALAECLRIVTGHVRIGTDTDDATLALEPDLDDHVSTTKGCYTGQEIVARIHTYGHVNRRIVPLAIDTAPGAELDLGPDAELVDADGDAVGRPRSAGRVPGADRWVALAVLPTAFLESGLPLRLGTADGPPAQVVGLRPA